MRLNQALLILSLVAGVMACRNENADDGSALSEDAAPTETASEGDSVSATARLQNATRGPVGMATLTQTPDGVLVRAELHSLPPGPHALHIHAKGSCEPPNFDSAGEHFNPDGKQHGFNNPAGPHAGDLPNFDVNGDGKATVETLSRTVSLQEGATNSLLKPGGASLVVHAAADDNQTDPAGESGDRIACGSIVQNESGRIE